MSTSTFLAVRGSPEPMPLSRFAPCTPLSGLDVACVQECIGLVYVARVAVSWCVGLFVIQHSTCCCWVGFDSDAFVRAHSWLIL